MSTDGPVTLTQIHDEAVLITDGPVNLTQIHDEIIVEHTNDANVPSHTSIIIVG